MTEGTLVQRFRYGGITHIYSENFEGDNLFYCQQSKETSDSIALTHL